MMMVVVVMMVLMMTLHSWPCAKHFSYIITVDLFFQQSPISFTVSIYFSPPHRSQPMLSSYLLWTSAIACALFSWLQTLSVQPHCITAARRIICRIISNHGSYLLAQILQWRPMNLDWNPNSLLQLTRPYRIWPCWSARPCLLFLSLPKWV